jgi:hypothetical protein
LTAKPCLEEARAKQVTVIFDRTGVAIIGGGPGGLAPLLSAHRSGRLAELLRAGVTIVERGDAVGAGTIGHWAISSDSTGFTFADCLAGPPNGELAAAREHPTTQEMMAADQGTVPLHRAGEFLAMVGKAVHEVVSAAPRGRVLSHCQAISTRRSRRGWVTHIKDERSGREHTLESDNVILATGATQPRERLEQEIVAGVNLVERCGNRLVQSGDILRHAGFAELTRQLASLGRAPKVAIIGGSTSAAAVAFGLLNRMPEVPWGPGSVTLMHRRELRIYYPTVELARADGYTEFGPDDICPLTRRVFRLAGFRLDSRELIMSARGLGGRPPEPRLRLHRLNVDNAASLAVLDEADIVIACFGYRPRALPVLDELGRRIKLRSETSPQAPLVDGYCRVMDADGNVLPHLFGMGLAAGFVPHGRLGGEPSFRGQANGLWLWQSEVGGMIVDAVLDPRFCENDTSALSQLNRVKATQEIEV